LRHCIDGRDNNCNTGQYSWSGLFYANVVYQYSTDTNYTYDYRSDRHRYAIDLTRRGIGIMGIECDHHQWNARYERDL
jgi:hypothetical protein